MKLLRYFTIVVAITINAQVFADATEDAVNALHDISYNLGIIMENPKGTAITFWGKTPAVGDIQPLKAKRKNIPLSADMKEYFENQLENAIRKFNNRLKDLEITISQLPASDFKKLAEAELQGAKGSKERLISDWGLAQYFK
jgi:hypothetical protein